MSNIFYSFQNFNFLDEFLSHDTDFFIHIAATLSVTLFFFLIHVMLFSGFWVNFLISFLFLLLSSRKLLTILQVGFLNSSSGPLPVSVWLTLWCILRSSYILEEFCCHAFHVSHVPAYVWYIWLFEYVFPFYLGIILLLRVHLLVQLRARNKLK